MPYLCLNASSFLCIPFLTSYQTVSIFFWATPPAESPRGTKTEVNKPNLAPVLPSIDSACDAGNVTCHRTRIFIAFSFITFSGMYRVLGGQDIHENGIVYHYGFSLLPRKSCLSAKTGWLEGGLTLSRRQLYTVHAVSLVRQASG